MYKLLLIADDFTGSLDTGTQFATRGIPTRICLKPDEKTLSLLNKENDDTSEVLVINSESRHFPDEEAYALIKKIMEVARTAGVSMIYKKTDSALRGCVAAEIAAVADVGLGPIAFVPAYPDTNRVTRGGIHYIDGIPVAESVFGQDPFNPVRESYIPTLLKPFNKELILIPKGHTNQCLKLKDTKAVCIFDAETQDDIRQICEYLKKSGMFTAFAGCAGLANEMADIWDFRRERTNRLKSTQHLFILSGSLNPITLQQIEKAEKDGIKRITLNEMQLLNKDYLNSEEGKSFIKELVNVLHCEKTLIVDTWSGDQISLKNMEKQELEQKRAKISTRLGEILSAIMDLSIDEKTIMVIGGDTLYQFIKQLKVSSLKPITLLEPGVVGTTFDYNGHTQQLITKSGGFGTKDTLKNVRNYLNDDN